ncbi:MAG: lysophospholipid acyltransferase family protein [Myxococcota bacterium]
MPFPPAIARMLSSAIGGAEVRDRAERLHFRDAGHGYDSFGMHPDFVAMGDALTGPLHRRYFRVKSYGVEHVPAEGSAILAANHSGTLPVDGMMLWADVLQKTDPPRNARAVADYFVSTLPIVSTLFARCGVVTGSRGNARALLEAGELLIIFPEGTPGIGKPFSHRYQLQDWRVGHCELAIRHRAPVVPVAIVGAEEQMPQVARIPLPKVSPVPYLPVPATPLPLPVRYHIYYGEPLRFDQEYEPRDADDPDLVRNAALRVRDAVQALINQGLEQREGIFR